MTVTREESEPARRQPLSDPAPQVAAVLTLDDVPAALSSLAGHGPPGKGGIAVVWSVQG